MPPNSPFVTTPVAPSPTPALAAASLSIIVGLKVTLSPTLNFVPLASSRMSCPMLMVTCLP